MTEKACLGCGLMKPLEAYAPQAAGLGGRTSRCRVCKSEEARRRREVDPEAARQRVRDYRAGQPDEVKAREREKSRARAAATRAADPEAARRKLKTWRASNRDQVNASAREHYHAKMRRDPEAVRARNRAYYAANRERRLAQQKANRRADPERYRAIENAVRVRRRYRIADGDLTAAQWRTIVEEFGGMCAWCETASADAMDHVVPLARGGRHTASNVVPACGPCNRSKSARLACDWLGFSEPGRAA